MGLVASIPGTLTINLAVTFKIRGACLGFASACASSAHALGYALDAIRLGRLDRVFVVGAEDLNIWNTVPFASVRALSQRTDPTSTPCAFDIKRDGFLPTGGATVLVLEKEESAQQRGAPRYAEILGWAETSDGYNIMAPEPNGAGLARCMDLALKASGVTPEEVDYVNAHATSTPSGDIAELRAIKQVFPEGHRPAVSSTKSLTGHGLCLAGAMEAGFTCLALQEKFMPVSANITEPDPECEGVPVLIKAVPDIPRVALSNSSGFGGSNVSLVFRALDS
jgi:3-oxoacyl-[acyl-carrier-protein] synthase-1